MRVILDTNVFISGVFFGGPPYRILEGWRDGKVQLVLSHEILEEYQRVGDTLVEQFPGVELQPMLELVTMNAELFSDQVVLEPVCEEPDDDKFIACALASGCKVTGVAFTLNNFYFPFCQVAPIRLCKLDPHFLSKNRRRPLKR